MWQGGNGWDDLMREQVEESTLKQRLGECFKFFVFYSFFYIYPKLKMSKEIYLFSTNKSLHK